MRCDYLRATFWGTEVFRDGKILDRFTYRLNQLAEVMGGTWEHQKNGRNGYAIRFSLVREGVVVCDALTDGSGDAEGSHQIEVQGERSVEVRAAMDEVFGLDGYATARRDTCLDLIDDEQFSTFHRLADIARDIAKRRRVTYQQLGQGWLGLPGETMTFYLGSRKSPVMIRVYLRGLKTINEGGDDNPLRIRIEVEVKPGKKAAKEELTRLEDAQLFGCSSWAKEFMQLADLAQPERIKIGTVWTPTDRDRVRNAMMRQYGKYILEEIDRLGPEGFAQAIRQHDEGRDRARKALESLVSSQLVDQL